MKNDPHFTVVLDASDVDFVEQLREALDITSGEQITFITPKFDREDGRIVKYFPRTVTEFDALKNLSDHALRSIGCGLWNKRHWLYPKEWYWNIPNGYPVVCINGKTEPFIPGQSDDDIRYGMLAWGFVKEQT